MIKRRFLLSGRWLALPSQKDLSSLALSASACEMFLVLKAHLHSVEQSLARPLFVLFWNRVAHDLNKFIFEEVLLLHKSQVYVVCVCKCVSV